MEDKTLLYGIIIDHGCEIMIYSIVERENGMFYLKEIVRTTCETSTQYYHESKTVEEVLEKIGAPFRFQFKPVS